MITSSVAGIKISLRYKMFFFMLNTYTLYHAAFKIDKCSKTGPITNTGRKVSAPIITTIQAKSIAKDGVAVGKRAEKGANLFCAKEPAIAKAGIKVKNLPQSIASAVVKL